MFAIRFGTPENASKFKTAFDKAGIESIENEALVIGQESGINLYNGCFDILSEPNGPSDSGDGEEEGEQSSKSNEAKKDGDVEPKKDDGAAGILNNSLEPRKSPGKVLARL